MKVSEWSDNYRYLSRESSAVPGPWRTDYTPYLREPMDAFNDPDIHTIVLMFGSQVGKTELIFNAFGYTVHKDPGPTMWVLPTKEMIKEFSGERIRPFIRDTPVLAELINDTNLRDARNKTLKKTYPGGYAVLVGANSPTELASRPIRYLFFDEADRFPASAGKEGDPIEIATKRTTTYKNLRKIIITSTPTIAGESRIELEYSKSDMRKYQVPCTHCGAFQVLTFKQVKWGKDKASGEHLPETAYYECFHCAAHLNDLDKIEMINNGKWIAENKTRGIAGFGALGQLYSPFVDFKDLAAGFLNAKKDTMTLKVWVNTVEGKTWKIKGLTVDKDELLARRETYGPAVPARAALLTASVDVQDNRLEYDIAAWGKGQECWLMEHGEILGATNEADVWDQLYAILTAPFDHESGAKLHIKSVTVDTGGHRTQEVYDFVKGRESLLHAIKGVGAKDKPFKTRAKWLEGPGVYLHNIGTEEGRDLMTNRLSIKRPGPGYVHFNMNFDEEYFKQLKAETRVTEMVRGVEKSFWKKTRKRNEAFDLMVYQFMSFYIFNPRDLDAAVDRLNATNEEKQARRAHKKSKKARPSSSFAKTGISKKFKI